MRALRIIPGLLFGLAFAGGGLFILSQTALPTWNDWYDMQKWQPTHALLLSVSGGENQTKARYQYQVNGVSHENDRVYVAHFSDNIGSYHEDLLTWLRNLQRTGKPVPVWVNPLDSRQAVIDRDMRWGLFAFMGGFCSVFIAIGLLVVYFSVTPTEKSAAFKRPSLLTLREEWKKRQREPGFKENFLEFSRSRIEALRQAHKQARKTDTGTTDWKTRKGWETPNLRSEAKGGVFMMWGFAILWNAISSPLLFVLPKEIEKENYVALVGFLFPLVGVFLLYKALTMTMEYRRFGKVLFEMDPYPGSIGGHVGGWVQVARLDYNSATASSSQLCVRLECVYSYMSGSGDRRSRHESIKWGEEGVPRLESSGQGVKLGFRFDVPDNLAEADVDQTDAYHFWRLTVKAQLDGVDLNRTYNVPVFRTGGSSRFVRHDVSAQVLKRRVQESGEAKQAIARGDFDLPGLSRAMRFSDEGGEIRMAFPMFRNKVLTVISGLFAAGFSFASYSIIGTALKGGAFGILAGLFGLPFVAVALAAIIAAIYLPFNNLRVSIAGNRLTVLRRLLFVPVFRRNWSATDISYLTLKKSGSTGQGVDKVEHFKLLAHDKNGTSLTIAEDLDGEDVAGHFRDFLAARLNVESRT